MAFVKSIRTRLREIRAKFVVYSGEVDNGNSGTAATIDWRLGNKQKITLTGNATLTFTNPEGQCNLILKIIQDATGNRIVTWDSDVKWAGAIAPTLSTGANKTDIAAFYYDGTNYFGVLSTDFG